MPPRDWQVPLWMWDTCDELAPSPDTFTSRVTDAWDGVTVTVPPAVTPGSGVSLKTSPAGLGVGEGLGDAVGVGEGDDVAADPPPQAIAETATAARANHALDITDAGYWSRRRLKPIHGEVPQPARG